MLMDNGYQPGIMTPYHQTYGTPQKKKCGWLMPVIIVVVLLLILAVVLVIMLPAKSSETKDDYQEVSIEDRESIEEIYDEFADTEVLNSEYEEAVQDTEHADYETERDSTRYSAFTASDVCSTFYRYCSNKFENIEDDKKVSALNSKALDYYLDNGYVVLMFAEFENSDKTYGTVIYSRSGSGLYGVFDTEEAKMSLVMSRAQIFNDVVGVPTFYVLE